MKYCSFQSNQTFNLEFFQIFNNHSLKNPKSDKNSTTYYNDLKWVRVISHLQQPLHLYNIQFRREINIFGKQNGVQI